MGVDFVDEILERSETKFAAFGEEGLPVCEKHNGLACGDEFLDASGASVGREEGVDVGFSVILRDPETVGSGGDDAPDADAFFLEGYPRLDIEGICVGVEEVPRALEAVEFLEGSTDSFGICVLDLSAEVPGRGNAGSNEVCRGENFCGEGYVSCEGFCVLFEGPFVFSFPCPFAFVKVVGVPVGEDLGCDVEVGGDFLLDDFEATLELFLG